MGLGSAIGGAIAGAIPSTIGKIIDYNAKKKQQGIQRSQFDQQMQAQEQFARHALQWKVEDAKKAGIHPLAALGASTSPFRS